MQMYMYTRSWKIQGGSTNWMILNFVQIQILKTCSLTIKDGSTYTKASLSGALAEKKNKPLIFYFNSNWWTTLASTNISYTYTDTSKAFRLSA